jgi:hypothetical protein
MRNESSVLVSCCNHTKVAGQEKEPLVQDNPISHLQGGENGIEARMSGAHIDNRTKA